MPKNNHLIVLILFLLLLIVLPSTVYAAYVSFPNGSFETGDLTNWTVDFNNTDQGAACQTAVNDATIAVGPYTPTNGSLALRFTNSSGNKNCYQIRNTSAYTFTGFYRFYADVNITSTSGNCANSVCKLQFYKNNTKSDTLCGPFQGPVSPLVVAAGPEVCDFNGTDFTFESFLSTNLTGGWQGSTRLDNFKYKQVPQLVHNVVEESDPFPIDGNFSITDALYDSINGGIVSDANCVITFNGTNAKMGFNSAIQKYEYTYSSPSATTVSYAIGCTNTSFETYSGYEPFPNYYNPDSNATGTVTFTTNLSTGNKLIVTDINNVSHQINDTNVEFTPVSETGDIIYSIDNNYTSSLDIPQIFFNSLTDGRQYWVYTADQTEYSSGTWLFDDTLTFGSTSSNPVQKIWNGDTQRYEYSFTDTLLSGELKYYKLSYLAPYKHYFTIKDSTDWVTLLQPNNIDGNGITVDQYLITNFSNIRSYYIEPIPDITQDEFQTATYELQFTAWSSVNGTLLYGGYTNFDIDSASSVTLSSTPHRYSVSIDGNTFDSQILFKTLNNSLANVYITDYAIVPRGYFTKRLNLFKSNGGPLDLFLVNGDSQKYLVEGAPYKIVTEAYDVDGKVQTLMVEAFFENTNADVNKVTEKITDLNTSDEKTFTFDEVRDGIIDLNGNAVNPVNPRNLIVKATLSDSDGVDFAQQSQQIKFVQFPYFGGDFQLQFFPTEKRKGKKPAGIVQINTSNIDSLEGLDIRIYDQNTSINSPDYLKRIYKGTDFTCIDGSCSFQLTIDDFLFEDANLAHFVITGIMNTEYFSLTNPLIQVDRTIYLSQIVFDTAKIYQVIERTNANIHLANRYNNTEEVPLFLALRTGDKENIKDQTNVYLTLENCDTDGNFQIPLLGINANCVSQSNKWYPTGYLYDDKFGYNVYYFRNIFLLDNGQLLPDGNYIGFHAHVTNKKGIINPITPVLAPRCNYQGIVDLVFFPAAAVSALSNLFGFTNGCQSGQQSDVVTTTLNSNQEIRIHIVNSYSPTSPAFPAQICLAPDTNNVVADSLKQDLICLVSYTVAEKPIDDFRFRLGNQFSDYSVTGANKQYVEFNVPFELVSYSDPLLLKAELESKGSTITTVGDFYYELFKDYIINTANFFGIPSKADFLLGNGLIPNIGGDINTAALNEAFSATTVSGLMLIDIKGVPIVNAQDFKFNSKISGVFDGIDRSKFLSYLQSKDVSYKTLVPASMRVVVSDITIPVTINDPQGAILIDQVPTQENINTNNLDANATTPFGNKVPASIILTLSSTMFYNNFSSSFTLANIIKIYAFFFQNLVNFLNEIFGGLTDPNADPIDSATEFLFGHVLILTILLIIIVIYAYAKSILWSGRSGR